MSPLLLIVLYCILTVLASLAGGALPSFLRLTHTRMQLMMSGVAGLMLGVGVLHLLPHAIGELPSADWAMVWMLAGLLGMFFLVRIFHFHQHGTAELQDGAAEHEHDHAHDHDHAHGHNHDHGGQHRMSWIGVALGLSVHTLLDGVALAAGVMAEAGGDDRPTFYGLGVFLAVLLHKPLDALSITSLMIAGGWPSRTRLLVNLGFSLMCPLGAAAFYLGAGELGASQHVVLGCALAFSAGVFICISLGDLLPELQFHTHDRVKLSIALLLGVALAYAIGLVEPAHVHPHAPAGHGHTHDHHGHAH